MKWNELNYDQLLKIPEKYYNQLAKYRPDWMTKNRPGLMAKYRPDWMADNRPDWMARYRPDWMADHRPGLMADHRPDWMARYRSELVNNYDIPEDIMKIIEGGTDVVKDS
jgi:hypothetical protein